MSEEVNKAKGFLNQARRADALVARYTEELERCRAKTTDIVSSMSSDELSGSTPNPHKYSDLIARILELEQKLDVAIDEMVDAKNRVVEVISRVESPQECAVLTRRYINCQRWEQIAFEMNYSYRGVLKINDRAIESVGERLRKANCINKI